VSSDKTFAPTFTTTTSLLSVLSNLSLPLFGYAHGVIRTARLLPDPWVLSLLSVLACEEGMIDQNSKSSSPFLPPSRFIIGKKKKVINSHASKK
jgi:hypothetical protein